MRARLFLAVTLLLSFTAPLFAAPPVQKGLRVNLKIPRLLFTTGPGSRNCVYCFPHTVEIESDGTTLRVAGREDWETAEFPSVKAFTVKKVSFENGITTVEMLDSHTPIDDAYRTLKFKGADFQDAFWKVVLPLSATEAEIEAYKRGVIQKMIEKRFPAESGVTAAQAESLIAYSRDKQQAISVDRKEFKGKSYLAVHLGVSPYKYNDLKVTDTQRLGLVFKERFLPAIRAYVPLLADTKLDGLQLRLVVAHEAFGPGFAGSNADDIEIYVPLDLAKKFADADITAQELVRGSIVLNNGSRFDIDLSQS